MNSLRSFRFMTCQSSQNGFTLTEVLIVVAIGVVLTASGFLSLNSFRNRKDVEFSMLEVTAVVRDTRERSVTQKDGFGWGIRFISTSTGDIYKVFQGSSYANGTTTATHSFRRPVEFGEPAGNRTVDILFNPISGKVSTRKIITVAPKASRSYVGDIIVNTQGLVTQRMEDNIVGYWHFDEGTGTSAYDASSNDNTGTLSGATWQSGLSCKAGDCTNFNGTSDYITGSGSSLNFQNKSEITLEAWFKIDGSTGNHAIINNGLNTYAYLMDIEGGRVRFVIDMDWAGDKDIYSTTNTLRDNKWHHVVSVLESSSATSSMKIYVDGVLETTQVISSYNISLSSSNFLIGQRQIGRYFNGLIDEVRVYSQALTASEIQAHYDDLK